MHVFITACVYEIHVQRHGPYLHVQKDEAEHTGRYCGAESEHYQSAIRQEVISIC